MKVIYSFHCLFCVLNTILKEKMKLEKVTFYNEVTQKVKEYYGDSATVKYSDVVKNNGLIRHGLCVKKNGSNCAPTIYLDDFYEEYAKGRDFEAVLSDVINLFEKHEIKGQVDLGFITDFDAIYDRICFRLIDSVRNEERLKNMPYRLVEDLAVTYFISLGVLGIEGNITVDNMLMKIWDVTEEDLYEAAMDNTPELLPAKIVSMGDFIGERTGDTRFASYFTGNRFLVASNTNFVGGAAVVIYPGLLKEVGDMMESDFYIIPSSRHEVIMIAASEIINGAFNLKDMVKCVNETSVLPEDVLSDNLYYFDRTCDNIKKVEYVKDTMVL